MTLRMPHGAGLGFRRELLAELKAAVPANIDFFELAPENWAGMGGRSARDLRHFTERHPFVCHGLSLSLGGPAPLDTALLQRIRAFMAEHGIGLYTEHLSWCADDHHLYELLPIPLTGDAVRWTAARIRQTQDLLGMQIGIENASYYVAPPGADLSEADRALVRYRFVDDLEWEEVAVLMAESPILDTQTLVRESARRRQRFHSLRRLLRERLQARGLDYDSLSI